ASHGNVEIQAKVVDSLISKGKFSSSETDIKIAVGHDPVKIETFTRLTAAKVAATEIKTTHPDEAASLEKMADASVKFMKNSNGIEAFTFKSNKTLTQDQFGLTTEAIKKANTVLSKAITYKMGERDSWAQVYEKFDQLSAGDQFGTPQEAFVQAIMDVKKVNREQAMEIVRKIKDCV
ncbi:MAG TPA: hypothetical protein VN132_06820, partial [Bdellovibrio sp.]|nr:hypothetical protein [Bdellovibrio sp.]